MLAALLGAGYALPLEAWVQVVLEWSRGLGRFGAPLVASLFIPASLLMLPATPISLATGAVFDLPGALLAVIVFSNLGAQAAFVVGRWFFRQPVARWVASNPKRQALELAVSSQGFRLVFLLRLSPLVPFNALNYALSVSKVNFRTYALASFLGMLPGTLFYVSLAHALGRTGRQWNAAELETGSMGNVLLGVGILTGFLAIGLITRRAKALLAKELEPER